MVPPRSAQLNDLTLGYSTRDSGSSSKFHHLAFACLACGTSVALGWLSRFLICYPIVRSLCKTNPFLNLEFSGWFVLICSVLVWWLSSRTPRTPVSVIAPAALFYTCEGQTVSSELCTSSNSTMSKFLQQNTQNYNNIIQIEISSNTSIYVKHPVCPSVCL